MESISKLCRNYTVMTRDTDYTRKLKLGAAFNYFQEVASLHAEQLGVGFDAIEQNHGVAWVMIRMQVEMLRYPEWKEEIRFETWPLPPKKLQFERDYLITDQQGSIIAKAASLWVLLDIETRELRKADTVSFNCTYTVDESVFKVFPNRIKISGESQLTYAKTVGCSDIDMNGHLNNSRYVDFIMDCFSLEELKKSRLRSIQVNFLNEAFPGDVIVLSRYTDPTDPSRIYIRGIREKDHSETFLSQLDLEIMD